MSQVKFSVPNDPKHLGMGFMVSFMAAQHLLRELSLTRGPGSWKEQLQAELEHLIKNATTEVSGDYTTSFEEEAATYETALRVLRAVFDSVGFEGHRNRFKGFTSFSGFRCRERRVSSTSPVSPAAQPMGRPLQFLSTTTAAALKRQRPMKGGRSATTAPSLGRTANRDGIE